MALAVGLAVAGPSGGSWLTGAVALAVGLVTAKLMGLYDLDHRAIRHLTIDELPLLFVWSVITVTAAALLGSEAMSLLGFGAVVVGAVTGALALRGLARYLWRRATPRERTLVLGHGAPAKAIARKIELFNDMHLKLERVAAPGDHLDNRNGDESRVMDRALAGIDRVILAWEDADPLLIERLLGHCRRREVKLSVVSPFRGRARPAGGISQVADLPVLEYNTWDVSRSTAALKRGSDVVVAGAALTVLSPLLALIALAIKLGDRGPVLFRQRRVGKGAVEFTMLKFRSMHVDAERPHEDLAEVNDIDALVRKRPDDPRVTRVGRVLRRFSLDELPQLINVLRGDMSIVGPRPEEPWIVAHYEEQHRARLNLRPGITGPMQVFGRGDLSFGERMAVELDYLENVSLARDARVLLATVPAVFRGGGAY